MRCVGLEPTTVPAFVDVEPASTELVADARRDTPVWYELVADARGAGNNGSVATSRPSTTIRAVILLAFLPKAGRQVETEVVATMKCCQNACGRR